MTSVPKILATTPFLQGVPTSLVSQPWVRFLSAVTQILGGGSDIQDLATFQSLVETSRVNYISPSDAQELADRVLILESQIAGMIPVQKYQDLQERIISLESQIKKDQESKVFTDSERISNLEAMPQSKQKEKYGEYYSSDGSQGIATTITTALLVGKTITVKDGLITSFQ